MIALQNILTGKIIKKTNDQYADMIKSGTSRQYNVLSQEKKDAPAEVGEALNKKKGKNEKQDEDKLNSG